MSDRPTPDIPLADVAVRLHPGDPVAIAKIELRPGARLAVDGGTVVVRQPIPIGHKLALAAVGEGQPVRRYGQVIGLARRDIAPGDHVHTHNLGADEVERVSATPDVPSALPSAEAERRTFLGYRRPDGRVGTRNYVAVISTVNCSAHAAREIARHFEHTGALASYPNVDGVLALTHSLGCPNRQARLERCLAGMARHPNVAAHVLVGLGCETNQAADLAARYGLGGGPPLIVQELGGLRRTIDAGIAAVEALLPAANAARRVPVPLSELVVALQCGGSDGWSGVTANPAVGLMADKVVRQGGTVVLAETPEIYGAEHLLAGRAATPEVAARLMECVRWWQAHAGQMGFQLDDNRSVGNAAGGLTTIYEKSLGAVAKGGSSPLAGVVDYAEPIAARGLVFMDSPGYDPVSVTGQVAGGCTVVVFTTGRGSVFGGRPAPCIKVGSNPALYRRMSDDIDIDAGRVLGAERAALPDVADELLDLLIAVASGRPSKSEAQGVGEAEFCPWNAEGAL